MSLKQPPVIFLLLLQQTAFSPAITFTIDAKKTAQTIDNFGASGAWFSEGIGKYWGAEKREELAELLFSEAFKKTGQPKAFLMYKSLV